jgi:hypothetical protein
MEIPRDGGRRESLSANTPTQPVPLHSTLYSHSHENWKQGILVNGNVLHFNPTLNISYYLSFLGGGGEDQNFKTQPAKTFVRISRSSSSTNQCTTRQSPAQLLKETPVVTGDDAPSSPQRTEYTKEQLRFCHSQSRMSGSVTHFYTFSKNSQNIRGRVSKCHKWK